MSGTADSAAGGSKPRVGVTGVFNHVLFLLDTSRNKILSKFRIVWLLSRLGNEQFALVFPSRSLCSAVVGATAAAAVGIQYDAAHYTGASQLLL